ncbi:MAG: PilW family protein [Thioalkalivibrionaceae bacterium]
MRASLDRTQAALLDRGVTLVELLVAIVVSLVLLAGVLAVFVATQQSSRTQAAVVSVQESARFISERVSRDIRQAGFLGCTNQHAMESRRSDGPLNSGIRNVLNPSPIIDDAPSYFDWRWDRGGFVSAGVADGNDWLRVVTFGDDQAFSVVGHDRNNDRIDVAPTEEIDPGDVMLVIDCRGGAIFEVTSTPAQIENNGHLFYAASSGATGNWTNRLGREFDSSARVYTLCKRGTSAANPCVGKTSGQLAAQVGAVTYRDLGDGRVERVDRFGSSELADSVVGFRVEMGVKSAAAPPEFKRPAALAAAEWRRVGAVRLEWLLAGRAAANVVDEPQTLRFGGDDWTSPDRRFHQSFELVQAIRNRND